MAGKRGRKTTRGKMGRIPQLPPKIKSKLDQMLRDGFSQAEILRRLKTPLEQIGEKPLSAAGLNRYATKVEGVGVRMRQAREVAEAWAAKFGESESKLSSHIIEMLRVLIFEHTLQAAETRDADGGEGAEGAEGAPVSQEVIAGLALAAQRIERAAEMGAKRDRELRQELAGVVDAEAKRQGLSPDTAGAIRAALLGDAAHAN